MMGAPTEIYLYGVNYWLICISIPIMGLITYYIYLPVFYDLQLTSTYEVSIIRLVNYVIFKIHGIQYLFVYI